MLEATNERRAARGDGLSARARSPRGSAASSARCASCADAFRSREARRPRNSGARWRGSLIVGCGGRGQALARDLARGRPRRPRHDARPRPRAARSRPPGAEPYVGDPDRIATLMDALAGDDGRVLADGQRADVAATLHDGRLRMLCEKLVDTPVRGLVYEAAGTLRPSGSTGARWSPRARATWKIPLEVAATPTRRTSRAWRSRACARPSSGCSRLALGKPPKADRN